MTRTEDDLDLIGTAEVADLLEIHRSVVTRRVSAGGIVPVKKLPGKTGSYMYRRSDIESLKSTPTVASAVLIPAAPRDGGGSSFVGVAAGAAPTDNA